MQFQQCQIPPVCVPDSILYIATEIFVVCLDLCQILIGVTFRFSLQVTLSFSIYIKVPVCLIAFLTRLCHILGGGFRGWANGPVQFTFNIFLIIVPIISVFHLFGSHTGIARTIINFVFIYLLLKIFFQMAIYGNKLFHF